MVYNQSMDTSIAWRFVVADCGSGNYGTASYNICVVGVAVCMTVYIVIRCGPVEPLHYGSAVADGPWPQ